MKISSALRLVMVASLLASPAFAADGDLANTYATWKFLRDTEAPLPDFNQAYGFLKNHPEWPQEKIIRSRTEAAALLTQSKQEFPFCQEFPPISGRGKLACMMAGAVDAKQQQQWLHEAWVNGDFNGDEEQWIVTRYSGLLKPADHLARLDRLLYERKIIPAKRMYSLVTPPYHQLADARIALMTSARNALAKLANVPKELRNHPGLILARIEWRSKKGFEDGVVEMFLAAPANPPYADRWWPLRASAVRQALREKKYDAALKILARHGDLENENLADALFLEGWIRMEFMHDPRAGYKDFYALYKNVETPVSKARAAYWAGRAATKNGNHDIANEWYQKAARWPTVFYGQLAQHALDENASLDLPDTPAISEIARQQFGQNEVVQALAHLPPTDFRPMFPLFLKALTDHADDAAEAQQISEMAVKMGGTNAGVKVAKLALRKQIVLTDAGWPRIQLPTDLGVEPDVALAITRQESEFDTNARSSADARGLMQLLPGTGAHVAKKLGLIYRPTDLWDGPRNVTYGAHYIGQLISGFNGSYVLAIASYNAGPANVRGWISRSGWPPREEVGAIDWVESIPYAETRNYVMRVLENLQVYRQIRDPDHKLELVRDLTR